MMKNKTTSQPVSRRVLGLLLTVLMLLSVIPASVFTVSADDEIFLLYIDNQDTGWMNKGIGGIFSLFGSHIDGIVKGVSAATSSNVYIGYLTGNKTYINQAGYDKWSSGYDGRGYDEKNPDRIVECRTVLHPNEANAEPATLTINGVYAYIQQHSQTSMTFEGPGTIKVMKTTEPSLQIEKGSVRFSNDANFISEKGNAVWLWSETVVDYIKGNGCFYSVEGTAIRNEGTIKSIAGGKIGYDTDGSSKAAVALSNEGTIDSISGGQIVNLKNDGGTVGEITGGVFDYTNAVEGCLFSDDLMGKVKDGYIVKLLDKAGNGKFEVLKNEDMTDGQYLAEPNPAEGYSLASTTETYTYNGKNYTLYTIETPNFCDVTFDENGATGGEAPAAAKVVETASYTVPGNPGALVKDNYTFAGWQCGDKTYVEGDKIENVTTALVFKAVWTPKEYTVTFTAVFGQGAPSPMTAPYDTEITIPDQVPVSMIPDQVFLGWKYNGVTYYPGDKLKVTGNMTVAASFGKAGFKITYDANGGTGAPAIADVGAEATVSTLVPTKEGFEFDGWTDGTNTYAPGAAITLTESITLTAVWKEATYTLSYDSIDESVEVKPGETAMVTATAPTRNGYIFKGWTDGTVVYGAGDSITMNSNVELHAVWDEIPISTVFVNVNEETETIRLILPVDDAAKYNRVGFLITVYPELLTEKDMSVVLNADGTTSSTSPYVFCTTDKLAGNAQQEVWSSVIADGDTYKASELAPKATYLYSYNIKGFDTEAKKDTMLYILPFYIDVNGEITYSEDVNEFCYHDGVKA